MLDWLLDRFRPPSVHLLADRLEAELYDAEPTSRMLDAFRREGRCDGKRGRDSGPTRRYLEDTADLVVSRIVGEFVVEDRQINSDLERSRQAIATAQERRDSLASMSSSTGDPDGAPDGSESSSPAESSLSHALGALAAKREADRRRQHEARLEEADRALEAALAERDALASGRVGLERSYRQRVESVHQAARVLWDRYLAGQERGREAARTEHSHRPEPELALEMPQALQVDGQTEGAS